MSADRRRSSLLFELNRAQSKITTLEEFIRDRERQFHATVVRLEHQDSHPAASTRRRRAGLSHDLLRTRSMSRDEQEEVPDEILSKPLLDDHVCLTVSRVVSESDGSHEPVPWMLRRFASREYHIGPEGAVIGSSPDAEVFLPKEAGLWDKHVEIKWISDPSKTTRNPKNSDKRLGGHFLLRDLTNGHGVFYISKNGDLLHTSIQEEELHGDTQNGGSLVDHDVSHKEALCPYDIPLRNGVSFVAGHFEFSLAALPANLLATIKMFSAARSGDLHKLIAIIESDSQHNSSVDCTQSEEMQQTVNVNSEYCTPTYGDESLFERTYRARIPSMQMLQRFVPPSPMSPPSIAVADLQPHKLLLHIAIGNRDTAMVIYLLEKGADPNLCSGTLDQSSLHLAAQLNLEEVMIELLKYGGDVEIRDCYLKQPLALTTSYEIRKLLLGVMMLCAAAEAGDVEEVDRLLSTFPISPNARGLRRKSALHLASAKGHTKVVQRLILNKANVSAKGGSRCRTPLHYASLNNNVEVARLLLDAGANEFARDSGGYTPLNLSLGGEMCKLLHKQPLSLCLAVQSGDLNEVKRILHACTDVDGEDKGIVDQRNEQSHAPLHLACATGNIAIVRVLVSHGADLNLHGGSDGWTPLFYAAMAGNADVVEFLLSVGASTEEVDCFGETVQDNVEKALNKIKEQLSTLEKRGRSESIKDAEVSLHTLEPASMTRQESATSCSTEAEKEWLSCRRDALSHVSQLLISGAERLLIALETRNLNDFKKLLESSIVAANVLVDKHNPTPVLIRACEDGLRDFVKVLLEHGALVNENGPMAHMPIMVAAANGYSDIVQLLADNGAKVNVQSLDTLSSPLHEAAIANSVDVVECLLDAGANMSVQNAAGEVPFDCSTSFDVRKKLAFGAYHLLVAASEGDCDMIRKMVNEEKISPSHEFQHGVTALHEACEGGHIEATQLLIDLGADVNKQIHSSLMSPLHIASLNNYIELGKALLKAGAKLDTKDSDGKVPFEVASTNKMRTVLVEARSVKVDPLPVESQDNNTCMICMVNTINTIILPCGHQAFCTTCVARITSCALDRQTIREVITVYK